MPDRRKNSHREIQRTKQQLAMKQGEDLDILNTIYLYQCLRHRFLLLDTEGPEANEKH